jgi:predicted phosphodiesterase
MTLLALEGRTMKLLILSDLHLELGVPLALPADLQFDVVVLAGDIDNPGRRAVDWARHEKAFEGRPVVLVPGNHEYYGSVMEEELRCMRSAASGSAVHLLSRDVAIIDGARFVGCTLWTDFQLAVQQPGGRMAVNVDQALREASAAMNDFRRIEVMAPARSQYRDRQMRRLLQAEDTLAQHWIERDWLLRVLSEPFDGATVVVTHHAPSGGSVAPRYASSWVTPAFVSHLPEEFFVVPSLWVHGHTHAAFDYERGGCRIVSNPRGYPARDGAFENNQFNAGWVVEVSASIHQGSHEAGATDA